MIKLNSSFPVFIVENITAAKAYYPENFGFNIVFENEWYLHLVSDTGIQIGFMIPNQPSQPKIFHPSYGGSGVIFSVEVNDADSAYNKAKENNLDIVLEIRSEDWGQRHFSIKDPNGIYLDIVQAIEPTEEYQDGYDAK